MKSLFCGIGTSLSRIIELVSIFGLAAHRVEFNRAQKY